MSDVEDIDDLVSNPGSPLSSPVTSRKSTLSQRSLTRLPVDDIDDLDSPLSARKLNADEPKPALVPPDRLQSILASVGRKSRRQPLQSKQVFPSIRVARDNYDESSRTRSRSARSYTPTAVVTRKPDLNLSPSERAFVWREKFKRLQQASPNVSIPDTNDPDVLERLYYEVLRTVKSSSSSATWIMYLGAGFAAVQFLLMKMGMKNIENFAGYQTEILKYYPHLFKELGDPGGPSIGSSWPPWLKLAVVIAINTVAFVAVTYFTGSSQSAFQLNRAIASTGIIGGSSNPTPESEVAGESAMSNIGGLLGGLMGGGGGGLGGMLKGFVGMMGNKSSMDDVDIDNPPEPVVESPIGSSNRQFSSTRRTPFDV